MIPESTIRVTEAIQEIVALSHREYDFSSQVESDFVAKATCAPITKHIRATDVAAWNR